MKNSIVDQDTIDGMRLKRFSGAILSSMHVGVAILFCNTRIFAKSEKVYHGRRTVYKTVRYQITHLDAGWRVMINVTYTPELYTVRIDRMYPNDAVTHTALSAWLAEACQ